VLPLLRPFARIPVCGLIAHYNDTAPPPGPNLVPSLMRKVLVNRYARTLGLVARTYVQALTRGRESENLPEPVEQGGTTWTNKKLGAAYRV
jgi:NADPH-dependent curcumin reductase CurA